MHSTVLNLIATAAFAVIVMISCDQCVGQHPSRVHDLRQPNGRVSGSIEDDELRNKGGQHPNANRLGNDLLSDLRSSRRATSEEGSFAERPPGPLQYEPAILAADFPTKLPSTFSNTTPAHRTQSFFDSDQAPPVVVVWLNSDLQTQLLTEAQLKQWMRSVPGHDSQIRNADIGTWQANSGSQVSLAGFEEPAPETPKGFAGATKKIEGFDGRLKDIKGRLEAKHAQIAADEVGDQVNKSELNNLVSIVSEWVARASSDLEKLRAESQEIIKFDKTLLAQQQALADEKRKANGELSSFFSLLPSDRSEAINVLQNKVKEDEVILQSGTDELNEIREKISVRDQRVTELPRLLRENAKEEDETKQMLESFEGQSDDLNRVLQKLRFDAKFLSLEITEKSLKLESRRKEQIGQMLPLQLEEQTLRIRRMKVELAELRTRSDKLRDEQLDERRLDARKALNEKLTQSTPQLKELAEFNFDLVSQKKTMAVKSDELEKELINVKHLKEVLDESQKRIEIQIETLGSTASGIRLVEHRRSLISTGKSQNRLLELADRLQHKQTEKLRVRERLNELVLSDDFKLDVLAKVEKQVGEQLDDQVDVIVQRQIAVDVANQLMETEKEYATDLLDMFGDNITKLLQLEAAHRALIDAVNDAKAFSDKNALWVRSSKPIEFSDLNRCRAGLQSVVTSDQWQKIGDHAYQTFRKRPYDVGLLAMVVGSLLVVRRRLRWSHE